MARQGRCQCGHILQFRNGANGFKGRCPKCGAVVRLQARAQQQTASRSHPRLPTYDSKTPLEISNAETFPALPVVPDSETNPTVGPLGVVEMVPLGPPPARSWTLLQIALVLGSGMAALFAGAVICLSVWLVMRLL